MIVPNPYNRKQVSHITLSPENVDCIVFWTKNPGGLLSGLKKIEELGYSFYFEYTLTGYGRDIECHLPSVEGKIESFLKLSELIGKERIDWRYDPIFLNEKYDILWHIKTFEKLCGRLYQYCDRCIISFIDLYDSKTAGFREVEESRLYTIAEEFSHIAKSFGLSLFACAQREDLSSFGIKRSACIDPERVERIAGKKLYVDKDRNQRTECGCVQSVDIGMYDTCLHGCKYCYATSSIKKAQNRAGNHNKGLPLLCGKMMGDEWVKRIP